METVLVIVGLLLFFGVWMFLSSFVGPALAFWIIPTVAVFYFWLPVTGVLIASAWIGISAGLVSFLRYEDGVEDYLKNMNDLRYNVGGPGRSLDLETLIWAFLMPGRMVLKLLRLESAPEARYIKSIPLKLGDCVRYHQEN